MCGSNDLDKKWRDNENVILILGKTLGGSTENMCVGKRIEPRFKEVGRGLLVLSIKPGVETGNMAL